MLCFRNTSVMKLWLLQVIIEWKSIHNFDCGSKIPLSTTVWNLACIATMVQKRLKITVLWWIITVLAKLTWAKGIKILPWLTLKYGWPFIRLKMSKGVKGVVYMLFTRIETTGKQPLLPLLTFSGCWYLLLQKLDLFINTFALIFDFKQVVACVFTSLQ